MHGSDPLLGRQSLPEVRVFVVGLRHGNDHDRPCAPARVLVGLPQASGLHILEHRHSAMPRPERLRSAPGIATKRPPIVPARAETMRTAASPHRLGGRGAHSRRLATSPADLGSVPQGVGFKRDLSTFGARMRRRARLHDLACHDRRHGVRPSADDGRALSAIVERCSPNLDGAEAGPKRREQVLLEEE